MIYLFYFCFFIPSGFFFSEIKRAPLGQEDYRVFTISKGEHRSTSSIQLVNTNRLRFRAIFDSSAIYKNTKAENQADINKLYGFSDCFSAHQENSARFGWRWYQGNLEIFAYCYYRGERISQLIGTIELDRSYIYEIEMQESKYIFRLNDRIKEIKRNCRGRSFGYKLYPYFGGDEVAPQEIKIKIQDL